MIINLALKELIYTKTLSFFWYSFALVKAVFYTNVILISMAL